LGAPAGLLCGEIMVGACEAGLPIELFSRRDFHHDKQI
jgi:hypothetical protein